MRSKILFFVLFSGSFVFAAPKKEAASENYRETATQELTPKSGDYSTGQRSTPATVVVSSLPVQDPIVYNGLQLGVTFQEYTPLGRGKIIGLPSYRYEYLNAAPMVGLQLRMLSKPLSFLGGPQVGPFLSVRYSKHRLPRYAYTNADLGDAELHSLWTTLGVAFQWNIPQYEENSLGFEAMVDRLDAVQASENRLANSSQYLWTSGASVFAKRKLGNFWTSLAYTRQTESFGKKRDISIAEDHFILGFSYALR
ncbi:MAG: hypothetical protein AB7O96_02815 [Pseudobdellovibrionaceae bacterium]